MQKFEKILLLVKDPEEMKKKNQTQVLEK